MGEKITGSASEATQGAEKENIRLFENEAADREFARVESECTSDSELLRRALRDTEVLLDDADRGIALRAKRIDGTVVELSPEMFFDPTGGQEWSVRRSLMLPPVAKMRINALRDRLKVDDVSAVARFALRFYAKMVREATAGARFFIFDKKTGRSKEIRFGAFDVMNSKGVTGGDSGVGPTPLPREAEMPKGPQAAGQRSALAAFAKASPVTHEI